MTDEEIVHEVNKTLHAGFELPLEKLKPDAQLFGELGLDSLDAVDMIVQLEEKFGMKVDAERLTDMRTLQNIYDLVGELANNRRPS